MDRLTKAEWRELFKALNLEVHVKNVENPISWSAKWKEIPPEIFHVEIYFGVPLKLPYDNIGSIVLNKPGAC